MIILRQKEFGIKDYFVDEALNKEVQRIKKKHPEWSDQQIIDKLKKSNKISSLIYPIAGTVSTISALNVAKNAETKLGHKAALGVAGLQAATTTASIILNKAKKKKIEQLVKDSGVKIEKDMPKKKDDTPKDKKLTRASVGLGTGMALSAVGIIKNLKNRVGKEEDKELISKLESQAKRDGVTILNNKDPFDAVSLSKKNLQKVVDKIKKNPNSKRNKRLKEELSKLGFDLNNEIDTSKNYISIGKNTYTPDTIAHELGHTSREKQKKLTRTLYGYGKRLNQFGTPLIGLGTGIRAGIKEENGEKEKIGNRLAGDITSILGDIPIIAEEVGASREGLKTLKSLGATKKQLKEGRRGLALAGGTYLLGAAKNVLRSEISHHIGKKIGKKIAKKKKEDDNNTKK